MTTRLPFRSLLLISPLLLCMGLRQSANAQQRGKFVSSANAPLTTEQVVENLVKRNLERAQALHAYLGTRIYQVEYRGFPNDRSAEMVVEVKYQSPGTKEFTIRSATGSKVIIDKVFKKLLQAEQEALAIEAQTRSVLNNDNYNFTLLEQQNTPSGLMYVLTVEPKIKDKFLYQGRIWVDAADFAVVRLEAEPAKKPSFWTKNSEIEQAYIKVGEFWLPVRNHSISEIRLGGTAELTIRYSNYRIMSKEQISNLSTVEPVRSVDTTHAQR
ncbi:hypothetical protein EDE15_4499 [Edaphobacter aggregans]|uniref:Outer membrane lipoprotein-sorting protein n=1 Tax=Edaphobacter aggregans TaxID=570835 RepID=A0A3R9NX56_9BACT|nr:hypothetical protein [Edaphobacter aggregans]RSL18893.1 hypothetical protein EDE15_4499 [Edaphobacter aggregans]